MQTPILQVERLSHRYSHQWAIRDISFEISQHGIVGLLGSNGAGKSTTMNIMCGVLNQTEGVVRINGIDLRKDPREAKKQLGFLPQNPPLHYDMTVDEYLVHCAHLRQLDKASVRPAVEAAKERCGVAHFSNRLIKNLSGGYRQRVGIAQAIIHRPRLVVLDEPTNGLDPNQILEVRKLIREIAEERAVIFSTHILSEVQAICKDIKMIEGGRVVFADTMEAFNNYLAPDSILVEMEWLPPVEGLQAVPGIVRAEILSPRQARLFFDGSGKVTETFIRKSVRMDWPLQEIYLERSSPDSIFARLSGHTPK
ncbi:MAG: ABC transporter ATP-binding protein [Candidatus Pseudobacter hemicellulosilyticus]|uniref:ABC transporter ATP-binding protein n=1 Tax=Candidatus Pseudobacter hemicellulosilyticus TaxID=3121375 RepID=A0AAJ5WPJ3_9BACT|nr:MAG: ABC transporter ATP-binding protein [Pseudobacter sp.]